MQAGFVDFGPSEIVSSRVPQPGEHEIYLSFLWYIRMRYTGDVVHDIPLNLPSMVRAERFLSPISILAMRGNIAGANIPTSTARRDRHWIYEDALAQFSSQCPLG